MDGLAIAGNQVWADALGEELRPLSARDVFDATTATDLHDIYWERDTDTIDPNDTGDGTQPLHGGAGAWETAA